MISKFKKAIFILGIAVTSIFGTVATAYAGTFELQIQNDGRTAIKAITVFGGEIVDFERTMPGDRGIFKVELEEGCVASIIVRFQARGNLRISNVDFCNGPAGYTISRK